MATYEIKAKQDSRSLALNPEDEAHLVGMGYVADAIYKGLKRIAKVIDNISIEVQEDED